MLKYNKSGVLPPFFPEGSPTDPNAMSPYVVSPEELVNQFGTNNERLGILRNFFELREEFRNVGIDSGVQWIAGSFVEDCEAIRQRPPNDIDIITFIQRPPQYNEDPDGWRALLSTNKHLFKPRWAKERFGCDSYVFDIGVNPRLTVSQSRYWFGLFSHQRDTYLWKGALQIELADCDEAARALLNGDAGDAS